MREIRKLTGSGHQTSILATDYRSPSAVVGGATFARWSQENFFRYMRQHYSLDSLVDYRTEEIPETTQVVNPAYRALDGQVRKRLGILSRMLAEFGATHLEGEIDPHLFCTKHNRNAAALAVASAATPSAFVAVDNTVLRKRRRAEDNSRSPAAPIAALGAYVRVLTG